MLSFRSSRPPDTVYNGVMTLLQMLPKEMLEEDVDIREYQRFVDDHGAILLNLPEFPKCNTTAAELRQEGNRLYRERRFDEALVKYNESICHATPGSEQLATGYSNRSAVYFELCEHDFALYNIGLARACSLPDGLKERLDAREERCLERQVPPDDTDEWGANVPINNSIRDLAEGIGMERFPNMGRGMVARKDFIPGDMVLSERPDIVAISQNLSYYMCHGCSDEFQRSLIPCRWCVTTMYCTVACMKKDWQRGHRFECCLVNNLHNASYSTANMAPRIFFYGLAAFQDNVSEMMTFCDTPAPNVTNPLEMDYRGDYNLLNRFKVLHNANMATDRRVEPQMKLFAAAFHHLFMRHSKIQSLFLTEIHSDFMLRCLLSHMRLTTWLMHNFFDQGGRCYSTLSPLASLFNHSCDPNAIMITEVGIQKVLIIRPVQKGEQILVPYLGRTWWNPEPQPNVENELYFVCHCVVCDSGEEGQRWRAKRKQKLPPNVLAKMEKDFVSTYGPIKLCGPRMVLKQCEYIVKINAHAHPSMPYAKFLSRYCKQLIKVVRMDNSTENVVKVRRFLKFNPKQFKW